MTSTTHADFDNNTDAFDVAKAFPASIHGKTILITGVNLDGIAFPAAEALASQAPSRIILASRSPSKVRHCIVALQKIHTDVDYRALQLDLSSQKAVRAAAAEVLSWEDVPSIDIVINNAAVMGMHERELSEDGIEMHLAVNHIGHFLLVNLIMPKLIHAAKRNEKGATRVINVTATSPIMSAMRWSDINFDKVNKDLPEAEQPCYAFHKKWGVPNPEERSYIAFEGYNQSKVANLLFSIGMNNRLWDRYGILSLASHPGVIMTTRLGDNASHELVEPVQGMIKSGAFFVKTAAQGAATIVLATIDPKLGLPVNKREDGKENVGAFLIDCQISDMANARSSSSAEADRLWTLSEELVKERFTW